MEKIILDLLTAILSVIIGVLAYQKMNLFYRLLFFQTILYLITDITATNFNPNVWLYNLYMPVETALLFMAARNCLNTKNSNRILMFLFVAFILIFSGEVMLRDLFHSFMGISAITEGLFLSAVFIYILFVQLSHRENNVVNIPVVLISLGHVLYFAVSIPYLSSIVNPSLMDPHTIQVLFEKIVVNLSSLRYLLLAVAFVLLYRGIIFTKQKA